MKLIIREYERRSIVTESGEQFAFFPSTDFGVEKARENAQTTLAAIQACNRQQAALDRIRARLAGEWFSPYGDLESDIGKVLRELDGTAEPDEGDEPEDSDGNPFDPESPEGRAVERGDMSTDGSLMLGGDTPAPSTHVLPPVVTGQMEIEPDVTAADLGVNAEAAPAETCQRCQGNGEIVTDWDRYMRGNEDENGNEAVAECPDCGGEGIIDATPAPQTRADSADA